MTIRLCLAQRARAWLRCAVAAGRELCRRRRTPCSRWPTCTRQCLPAPSTADDRRPLDPPRIGQKGVSDHGFIRLIRFGGGGGGVARDAAAARRLWAATLHAQPQAWLVVSCAWAHLRGRELPWPQCVPRSPRLPLRLCLHQRSPPPVRASAWRGGRDWAFGSGASGAAPVVAQRSGLAVATAAADRNMVLLLCLVNCLRCARPFAAHHPTVQSTPRRRWESQ